jgi:acyl dehydratase
MARVIETLEELRGLVGQEVGASGWVTVSQETIDQFAELTGDKQWIHVDLERARAESPYGNTIAHGFLTLALLSQLSRDAMDIRGNYRLRVNYGLNRVRFPAAVSSGARVRARFTVQSVEQTSGVVQVVFTAIVEIEGAAKPALAAEWVIRLYE